MSPVLMMVPMLIVIPNQLLVQPQIVGHVRELLMTVVWNETGAMLGSIPVLCVGACHIV